MDYEFICSQEALDSFLDSIRPAPVVAFDTEFVSEDRFRPQLCLIQVACEGRLAVIDPLQFESTLPFWEFLTQPGRVVLAHAAREEIRFCYRYTEKTIAGLFDIQLAAGFVGLEYPMSLGNLVARLLALALPKGETRTNWRARPLTQHQLEYALNDVTELEKLYGILNAQILKSGRLEWLEEETTLLQQSVIELETEERWRKVSGSSGFGGRQLEIVRQLWLWRERRGRQLDQPARRILRDDLIIELAKRQCSSIDRIRNIRGMEHRGVANQIREISQAIEQALNTPESELPRRPRGSRTAISPMLSQFLSTAMACVCRQHHISPAIVGNSDDVRELIAYELASPMDKREHADEKLPSLLRGWRGGVVGDSFKRLLEGNLAIRIADKDAEQPLEFYSLDDAGPL